MFSGSSFLQENIEQGNEGDFSSELKLYDKTMVISHQPLPSRNDDFEEEFQLPAVVSGIRNCVSLECETDKNLKIVVKAQVPDMEKTRNNLKGKSNLSEIIEI